MKGNKRIPIIIMSILILLIIGVMIYFYFFEFKKEKDKDIDKDAVNSSYLIRDNSLQNFDLHFLKVENEKKNKIYSPLSIKNGLKMLEDATKGESKKQVTDVLGQYNVKKYTNNQNMSFANAFFIRDSYKEFISKTYVDNLTEKYGAEVIYDTFANADNINSWVSDKTFNLINNLIGDVSQNNYVLLNTLAIDMEWVKQIQSENDYYVQIYEHENFLHNITKLDMSNYYEFIDFKDVSYKVEAVELGATINKYDIVNILGEENIRSTIREKYQEWLINQDPQPCNASDTGVDVDTYLDKYIEEINSNYKKIASSTDFNFYVDDDVKVFAKDLKESNGVTLQYVGIMPKKDSLDSYIENITPTKINELINNLKAVELDSFKEGVITKITGYIPTFKFDYDLNLMNDLSKLGITDVFDTDKADLSGLTSNKASVNGMIHKTTIDFSNRGITATNITGDSCIGRVKCGFQYNYEPPVETIDLTFDSPYLFIIRDKNSGEVWFTGTVYEPNKYISNR